jgi:hypothetical protein
MFKLLLGAVAIAALFSTAAQADACKVKLSLAGGTVNSGVVTRHNPANVTYTSQWSDLAYWQASSDLDLVYVGINLQWTTIGTPGKGNVWIGGLPPQTGVGGGFSNGSGVFSGFTETAGNSLSLDNNLTIAPYGLAYITDSAQGDPQADNVQWKSGISTGPGRLRFAIFFLTKDSDLRSWLSVQPSSLVTCGY